MRTLTIAAAAIATAVLLAGCAGGEASPVPTATPVVDAAVSAPPTETVAPLVAETPTAAEPSEAEFLAAARGYMRGTASQIPNASDEQLLVAGHLACERLAAGVVIDDLSVIEGEVRNSESGLYVDSVSIAMAARASLCP